MAGNRKREEKGENRASPAKEGEVSQEEVKAAEKKIYLRGKEGRSLILYLRREKGEGLRKKKEGGKASTFRTEEKRNLEGG